MWQQDDNTYAITSYHNVSFSFSSTHGFENDTLVSAHIVVGPWTAEAYVSGGIVSVLSHVFRIRVSGGGKIWGVSRGIESVLARVAL
jgi:hypothetical protein